MAFLRRCGLRCAGAVGVVLFVVGLVVAVRSADGMALAERREALLDLVSDPRDALVAWVESRHAATRTVAGYPTTQVLLGARDPVPLPFSPPEGGVSHLRGLLASFCAQVGCTGAFVFDRRGEVVASAGDGPPGETERSLARDAVARGVGAAKDHVEGARVSAWFSQPVVDPRDGVVRGAVVVGDELHVVASRALAAQRGRGRTGGLWLVADGPPARALAATRRDGTSVPAGAPVPDPGLVAALPSVAPTGGLEHTDADGEDWLAAYARVPDTPWVFVGRVRRSDALWSGRTVVAAVGGALLAALLGLGLALFAARAIRAARAESAASAQARRFAAALDRSDHVATFVDRAGRVVDARGATARVFGLAPPAVVGSDALSLCAPGDRARLGAALDEARGPAGRARTSVACARPDGADGAADVGVSALEGTDDLLVTWTDATERRAAEARLRESEEAHRLLFDANPSPMWAFDAETLRFLAVNDAATSVYGYTREEFLARTIRDIRPAEELPRLEAALAARRAGGSQAASASEWRHVGKDGVPFPVRVRSRAIELRGRPARLVLAEDLRERRAAEETARTLARALEQSPLAVLITDRDGRIQYVNPHFCAVTGYGSEEALGANPRILRSDETPASVHADLWRALTAGRTWQGEFVNRRKDGRTYPAAATVSPVHDAAGVVSHYVGIHEDLSARRAMERRASVAEAQLAQSQKLEAIGQLAGGVAHDFNNLLCVILGYGQLALTALGRDHPEAGKLEQVVAAGRKAEALARQLLAFSRRQVLQPRVVDVGASLRDLERMLRRLLGEDVALETAVEGASPVVLVDPGQLEQVVLNLAVNARDAMPRGGRLRIVVRTEDVAEADEPQGGRLEPGSYVVVEVSDDGVGMDAATQARVFEPFFTTKPAGKGTGLGLATVHGIVRQSGGTVGFRSAPGRGTTFRVWLPRLARESAPPDVALDDLAPFCGRERVLVVEDQEPIRRLVQTWLEALGYRVTTASDGAAALDLAVRMPGPADLLLTDVVMPNLGGADLAAQLGARWPAMRVVYMSGYTADVVARHGILEPGILLVDKPLDHLALARTVRTALDVPPRTAPGGGSGAAPTPPGGAGPAVSPAP